MSTLVLGATGATGMLLVEQLISRGRKVKIVVRSPERVPAGWRDHPLVTTVHASISEIRKSDMEAIIRDCDTLASCLGHTLSWKGIFGPPRRLVTDAIRLSCEAIRGNAPTSPSRVVLMNTAGNRHRGSDERLTSGERIVTSLLRLCIPPHADNEAAAEHLRTAVGQNNDLIEWAVVRPDTLTNEAAVSGYRTLASPDRSAIFNPGRTSRINVAHFMADLLTEEAVWRRWRGRMPVIYNADRNG